MKKRGSVRDVGLIAILLFGIAILFLVVHYSSNVIYDTLINNSKFNDSADAVEVFEEGKNLTNRLDYVVFVFFIALVIGLIITGFLIGGIPIFMFIYFLVVCVIVGISMILSNTWETISQKATFIVTLTAFPITNNLMTYLPIYMAIVGILGMIVMFAKPVFGGGQNE